MKGRWMYIERMAGSNESVLVLECSNCGKRTVVPEPPTVMREDLEPFWKALEYCPNCNADMRSEKYIAEIERKKKKEEDDLIERIADRLIDKLTYSPVVILCDELPKTGKSGHIYVIGVKQYVWQEDAWVKIN